jgi:hypothetical protein
MNPIDDYLETLATELKVSKKAKERILTETEDHLRERAEREEARGVSRAAAENDAIKSFGPAIEFACDFVAERATRATRSLWPLLAMPAGIALFMPVIVPTAYKAVVRDNDDLNRTFVAGLTTPYDFTDVAVFLTILLGCSWLFLWSKRSHVLPAKRLFRGLAGVWIADCLLGFQAVLWLPRDIPPLAVGVCGLQIALCTWIWVRASNASKLVKQSKELTERTTPPASLAA